MRRMADTLTSERPEEPAATILQVPSPALKTRARKVVAGDAEHVRALLPAMFRLMYQAPGIGLAAPQVGISLRLVVIDLAPDDVPAAMTLINPEIVSVSDSWVTREEGCLSLPGIYADVARPARVVVRYQDDAFSSRTIEADGLLAACLQHEIDHLDGVLFIDHLSALKRNMLLRRFSKERRERASAPPRRDAG